MLTHHEKKVAQYKFLIWELIGSTKLQIISVDFNAAPSAVELYNGRRVQLTPHMPSGELRLHDPKQELIKLLFDPTDPFFPIKIPVLTINKFTFHGVFATAYDTLDNTVTCAFDFVERTTPRGIL